MDRGAHFFKCDFQVHTPRDLNWGGEGAVTPDERQRYSENFVAACRRLGLGAVAITDHHDFAFVPSSAPRPKPKPEQPASLFPRSNSLWCFPVWS